MSLEEDHSHSVKGEPSASFLYVKLQNTESYFSILLSIKLIFPIMPSALLLPQAKLSR